MVVFMGKVILTHFFDALYIALYSQDDFSHSLRWIIARHFRAFIERFCGRDFGACF